MAADVLFLDVETPNGHNDRISSIGLIRCDCNGTVLAEDSYLVDPEEPFSEINMRLTGISHADVVGAPTFPQIWSRSLKSLFDGAALVAHNASFDLAVLWKLLMPMSLTGPSGITPALESLPSSGIQNTRTISFQRFADA